MSAAWSATVPDTQEPERAKRFIRLWGYLAIASTFLMYVSTRIHVGLF